VIPFDAPGGVETAALSALHIRDAAFDFRVQVLFPGDLTRALRLRSFNPFFYLGAARRLAVQAPDFLIVSLWRASIVGVLFRVLRPKTKLVVFLHCARSVHFVDKWVTRVAVRIATEVWSDSRATIEAICPGYPQDRVEIISYIPYDFPPVTKVTPTPVFIYWGRLARQKNLHRAMKIFAEVRRRVGVATFLVIGPDGGELDTLRELCKTLGIHDAVSFLGPKTQCEIVDFAREASFFVHTSEFEGMGLAVVEAMQMGLVPVVTGVGEVGRYCQNCINAILLRHDEEVVLNIIKVMESPILFERMRANAIAEWSGRPIYRDQILQKCKRLSTEPLSKFPDRPGC
jgi:glycosyltransferase involved in cell wall biosynthesis